MRQAIETKFLSPTNHKGQRIAAHAVAGTLIFPWDYELSVEENHAKAAQMFADHFKWRGPWTGGQLRSGNYVFVQVS